MGAGEFRPFWGFSRALFTAKVGSSKVCAPTLEEVVSVLSKLSIVVLSALVFSCGYSEEEWQAQLYQQIGQLKVELDWMKKKAGLER